MWIVGRLVQVTFQCGELFQSRALYEVVQSVLVLGFGAFYFTSRLGNNSSSAATVVICDLNGRVFLALITRDESIFFVRLGHR